MPETRTGLLVEIEPFDPARHQRQGFSCGSARVDNYLKRTAKKHTRRDFVRLFVAVRPGKKTVLGYYALNAHALDASALPEPFLRQAPRHGRIPAAYLSVIGVDKACQRQGLGQVLLVDALKRVLALSEDIGLTAVVLDVLEGGGDALVARRRHFYERMGFTPLPSRPGRMFLTIRDIRAAFDQA